MHYLLLGMIPDLHEWPPSVSVGLLSAFCFSSRDCQPCCFMCDYGSLGLPDHSLLSRQFMSAHLDYCNDLTLYHC